MSALIARHQQAIKWPVPIRIRSLQVLDMACPTTPCTGPTVTLGAPIRRRRTPAMDDGPRGPSGETQAVGRIPNAIEREHMTSRASGLRERQTRSAFVILVCLFACACGGGGGPSSTDAAARLDANVGGQVDGGCGGGPAVGIQGDVSSCTATLTFGCNGGDYKAICTCPAASCDCIKNGVVLRKIAFPRCPGCGDHPTGSDTYDEDVRCGFP